MGKSWVSVGALAFLVVALAGCYNTRHKRVKPPQYTEEYVLPPNDEARFSKPAKYPKKAMANQKLKSLKDDPATRQQMLQGPGGFGGPMGAGGSGTR